MKEKISEKCKRLDREIKNLKKEKFRLEKQIVELGEQNLKIRQQKLKVDEENIVLKRNFSLLSLKKRNRLKTLSPSIMRKNQQKNRSIKAAYNLHLNPSAILLWQI